MNWIFQKLRKNSWIKDCGNLQKNLCELKNKLEKSKILAVNKDKEIKKSNLSIDKINTLIENNQSVIENKEELIFKLKTENGGLLKNIGELKNEIEKSRVLVVIK